MRLGSLDPDLAEVGEARSSVAGEDPEEGSREGRVEVAGLLEPEELDLLPLGREHLRGEVLVGSRKGPGRLEAEGEQD